jgi:hypothetical protein
MAVLLIPVTPGVPFQTSRVKLEGKDYGLRWTWNQRQARWFLDMSDTDGTLLFAGVKILANRLLLQGRRWNPNVPPGELIAADLTGDGSPPGLDELGIGRRVEITYLESTA